VSYTEAEQTSLLEQLARASLEQRAVERRSLWMELSEQCIASALQRPQTHDARLLALAAASAEMLAEQQGCAPPCWTAEVGPVEPAVYLDTRATPEGLKRMREQSPLPFRRRGFYAPAKYCQLTG
jgi:hypothetical protein